MESTDYTKFTHPKDCTSAVANIERCFNKDPLRMRITIPGVASALVFSKLRLRLTLKDEHCADGAHPLPVKGIVPAPVYSSIILNGNMLYEAEADLSCPPKALPYILELTAGNATIDGNAYNTTQELYDALQSIVADCSCNCSGQEPEPEPELMARMVGMEMVIEEEPSATIDTTGSTGNFIRLSYVQKVGANVNGDWEPNTGGNQLAVDIGQLYGTCLAIVVQVSDDMLAIADSRTAELVRGATLFLPQPNTNFDFDVDSFFSACSGSKSFGAAILVVANNGLNASTGVLSIDIAATSGQPFVVYRLCDGDMDKLYLDQTDQGAVRISNLDMFINQANATSNLPTNGDYYLKLWYKDGIFFQPFDSGDVPYISTPQSDTYSAGLANGNTIRAVFSRVGMPALTYTDDKLIPSPVITAVVGASSYDFTVADIAIDSGHPDFTGHLFVSVKLIIIGGTYAGTHSISDFVIGGTPDISALPVGLQALLVAGVNTLSVDEDLWLVEGATQFELGLTGRNSYGAVSLDSDAVLSNYTP